MTSRSFLTLGLLALLTGSSRGDEPAVPADIVIRNARVITVDAQSRIAEAVAIRGDRIVAVGTEAELAPLVGPKTESIDGNRKALLPGKCLVGA